MKMTDFEILTEYREAKDKKKQVKILADRNVCGVWEMALFLKELGAEINLRWFQNLNPKRDEVNKKMGISSEGQDRAVQDGTGQVSKTSIDGMLDVIRVFVAGLSGMQAWMYGELLRAVFKLRFSCNRESFDQLHELLRMIEAETEANKQ